MSSNDYERGARDLIGPSLGIYVGYSTNEATRRDASSGGIVKEIFTYLLMSGKVDGCLIVVQSYPKFFTKIARTVEELSEMENSVYAPVNFGWGLKQMIEGEKYAVTVIGCQNKLLKKVEHLIYFKIGLLCRGTYEESTMPAYAKSFGHEVIENFAFRRNGWPGEIIITTDKGDFAYPRRPSFIKSPKLRAVKEAYFSKATYLPKCVECKYEFSFPSCDVSMGDAWHAKYSSDTKGLTLAITRTQLAEELLEELGASKKIVYWPDSHEETNEVMDDPNVVKNYDLKRWMYKREKLRVLMPLLVFFEQYILAFPWKASVSKLRAHVSPFKGK